MPLIVNLVATAFMTGLIWCVQVAHYPLMSGWPHHDFGRWEAMHRGRIGAVVVPAMLVEGFAAAWLLARRPAGIPAWMPWAAAVVLAAIWASTFLVQVPLHERLSAGWDEGAHARLVATNWIRTVLWSMRLGLVVAMLLMAQRGLERP
jgi:hypothetical protein